MTKPLNCTKIDPTCNGHGNCNSGICKCISYWEGDLCEVSFKDELGNVFIFWKCIFIVFYGSIFLFLLYKLLSYFIKLHPTISLKLVCYLLLLSNTIFRIIYLALDPMTQTYLVPPVLSELLSGLALYFIFTAYLMVLMHWISVYHHVFSVKSNAIFIPITRNIFLVVDGIWLAAEVTVRILYGLELSNVLHLPSGLDTVDLVEGIYMASVGFSLSFFFMIYGSLIFFKIRDAQFQKKTKQKIFRKLTFIITILSWTFLLATVCLILIMVFNGSSTPFGALFSFTAQFVFEIILIIEMFYILKKDEEKK